MDGMIESQRGNQLTNKIDRSVESIIQVCRKLIDSMKLNLLVDGKEEAGTICINISGNDRPFLLSNSASVLNSLEYILNKMVREGRDDGAGILLDSDGYRKHREAELTLLAEMASKKVISLRKPLGLQPMTPRERRIVHLALAGIEGVTTQSSGEGENRSITIFPS
jgi:spoIIIJ-associated protein